VSQEELLLECLKLALEQARREATSDLNRVAELQTWFYNRIAQAPAVQPEKADGRRKKAADKSLDPFE
jgi:hypothetical protein